MGLGKLFWPLICSLPRHHDRWYFDVKYCQIHFHAINMFKRSWPLQISTFLWFSSNPDSQRHYVPLSRVDDVGKTMAHLRSRSLLSTSTHYPGSWSRDSLLVPWSLHASMVGSSRSTWGFHHWPLIEWFYRCSTPAHWFTCRILYL